MVQCSVFCSHHTIHHAIHRRAARPLVRYVPPPPPPLLSPSLAHSQADAEKDKYFKIEADNLATPTVKYTTSTVKRITEDRRDARLDKKAKRIRREGMAPRALPPGNLAGALLRREMGACVGWAEADVAAGLWAAELAHKGGMKMSDTVDLFVGGDKDTGLAVVFGGKLSCWNCRGGGLIADSGQYLRGVRLGRPTFQLMLMTSRWLGERIVDGVLC